MAEKVRWGILSTANIGRKAVTPALNSSRNGEVIAVASRDPDRARAYAEEQGIPFHYGSYEELLRDSDIDAIYNPLPNSLHKEWTIKALQAGKHVLCEKPLGMSTQECLSMHEAAQASGRILMEAFMYRFHPRIERVIERLTERPLGNLKLVRSSFTFMITDLQNIRLQSDLGGGALMDVGCYCVNASRTILQQEPVEAQAFAVWSESGVDTELVGTLRFPGDLFAQFHCAIDTFRQEHVEIIGDEGRLYLDKAFLPGTSDTTVQTFTRDKGKELESVSGADEYQLMGEHFADCVLNGTEPRHSAREAAANLAALDALHRSAREGGRPQKILKV